MSKSSGPARAIVTLFVLVVLAAPATMLVSVYGTRLGFFDIATGLGTLGLKVVPLMSWVALGAGVLASLLALLNRSMLPMALGALAVAAVMVGGFHYQTRNFGPAPRDITSNVDDPPTFAGRLGQERRSARPPASIPVMCDGVEAVPSQMASDSVAWAMDKAGITVMGVSPFRVDGWTESNFYGIRHDVSVRIRPGRTDIRIAARDNQPLGDQACDLARALTAALNEARAAA